MAALSVPAKIESNFVTGDGEKASSIEEAFQFKSDKVENVYSWDKTTATLKFSFQEKGTAYGDSQPSQFLVESSLSCRDKRNVSFHFNPVQIDRWALNFAATITVAHGDGGKYMIYLPGTRTYDPAGKTGDPHASERIGPSCSRTQAVITLGQIMGSLHGADGTALEGLQEKLRPLVNRYHGRETLFDWMLLQIRETVYLCKEVTPYPEFIKSRIASKKLVLDDSRAHTRSYLESYNVGAAVLPQLYYRKVSQKDPIDEIFGKGDLVTFKKLANI